MNEHAVEPARPAAGGTSADAPPALTLVTVVFERDGDGTRMTFTEQVVFFDGHGDLDERREGTEIGLSNLDDVV